MPKGQNFLKKFPSDMKRLFSISRSLRANPVQDPIKIESTAPSEIQRAQQEAFNRIFDTAMSNLERKNENSARNAKLSSSLNQLFQPSPTLVSSSIAQPLMSAVADGSFLHTKDPIPVELEPALAEISELKTSKQVHDYFDGLVARFDPNATGWGSKTKVSPKSLQYLVAGCLETLFAIKQPMAAFNLFNLAKNQTLQFTEAACAERTYNVIIMALWEYYRDLKMVTDCVSDMSLNAGAGNNRTAAILHTITTEALSAKRGKLDRFRLPLWTRKDEANCDTLLNHRRCIVDVLSARAGLHQTTFLS